MQFKDSLANFNISFTQQVQDLFDQQPESVSPKLLSAMRYSVENGGKRIRPYLMALIAETIGVNSDKILPAALALECIHSYSLVHDDLPAMDDDSLRRGKPTCHIQFDEATAILAGDALQALAFSLISNADIGDNVKVNWTQCLAKHSGYLGMCGGQSLDLIAENEQVDLAQLEKIHSLKTGALLKCAANMACAAKPELELSTYQKFNRFTALIGLAFQIQDDILDVVSTTELLGKPQGSDEKLAKSTYPSLLGLEGAKQKAQQVYQSALEQLAEVPYNTDSLAAFAEFIINRKY